MNRQLVGEPGVSAFLRSVSRSLAAHNIRLKPSNAFPIHYNPRNDLKKLKDMLTSVQDLLIDGEARRFGEESVDEWMDDFKDLLYDVEDLLDDVKSPTKDQVRAHELYLITDELKRRFGKILDRTQVLRNRAKDLDLKRGRGSEHTVWGKSRSVTLRSRETSSMVDTSEIHGREEDKDIIVKRLLQVNAKRKRLLQVDAKPKKNYDVVCIVGIGGLGKTTLAQLVFNDEEVEKHFDLRSWVCISNDFDVARATKQLIEYSGGGGSIGDQQSLASLQKRLKEMIGNKRCLLVLDDVWSTDEWDKMRVPFSLCANGSKILITTRNINIAHIVGNKDPYQLQGLNHEKCMEIFRDRAFGDDDGEEEKVCLEEKIVRACGGIPLAVKVIGSLLQMADVEKWRLVSENTAAWANKNDEILPAIRLSYYDLPASLKRCFEYLALFPPDYPFDQDDVVRLWIADGLVEEEEGRRVEDIGNEYYNELKARSLIQEDDRMHDIVHHLATVLSRKFCYKENSKEPNASVRHAFLVKPNAMHYEFLSKAPCLRTLIVIEVKDEYVLGHTIKSCKMIRALKITSQGFEIGPTSPLRECLKDYQTHIRFLAIEVSSISHLPNSLCVLDKLQFLVCKYLENLPDRMNNLSNLRHLDLSFSYLSSLPESICHLGQLQVLILFHCGCLKGLPKDIGNLRNLRTLDLYATSVVDIPESICALDQLQVLILGYCRSLKELPKDIGNLRSLRKIDLVATPITSLPTSILSILNVTGLPNLYSGKRRLPLRIESIAGLNELARYCVGKEEERHSGEFKINIIGRVEIIMDNIGSIEEANTSDLKNTKNIRGIEFRWNQSRNDQEMEVKIMEALEPHPALEYLEFYNYGGDKFPGWIMSTNIYWSNLVELKMEGLDKVCQVTEMEFVLLERLSIKQCPKLRKVLMATPKLGRLCIMNCGELEADCVHFLPSISNKGDVLYIISQLRALTCDYNIFEYLFDRLKAENLK